MDYQEKKKGSIITVRRIVGYTFLVELYNVMVYLFGVFLHSDSPLKGYGFWDVSVMFMQTIIPDLMIIFVVFMIVFYGTRRVGWLLSHPFFKIAADVFLSVAVAFAVYRLFYVIVLLRSPDMKMNWDEAFINVTLILLIVEIIYYAYNLKSTVRQAEQARREALQYKYNVLKAQVNPHFLFNSLNILSQLIDEDVHKSHQFIDALSGLYRYVMEHQDKHEAWLTDEMQSAEAYVSILKMRYMNQFEVIVEGKENMCGKKLIPMTMQLLIENITKHNVVSTKYPMRASISIMQDCVVITNPVRKRDFSSGSGVGLRYICEQYRLCGKEVTIKETGDLFSVNVPYLP